MDDKLKYSLLLAISISEEICRQFEVANVKMMITIPPLLQISNYLKANLPSYRGTICIGGSDDRDNNVFNFQSLITTEHIADLPTINPKDIAVIPFSSGTSGLPKVCRQTFHHYSIQELCPLIYFIVIGCSFN